MENKLIKYYQKERKNPIEDAVMFFASEKADKRDLHALYAKVAQMHPGLELVWVGNDAPNGAMPVVKGEKIYYYYLARARFIIANDRIDSNYLKRKVQRYIQIRPTAIKPIGLELDTNQEFEKYRKRIVARLEDARRWSFIATDSDVSYGIIRDAFAMKEKRVLAGRPAFDYIFNSEEIRQEIKENHQKVILVDFKQKQLQGAASYINAQYEVIDLNDNDLNYSSEELKIMADIYITDHLDNTIEMANFNRPMIFVKTPNTPQYRFDIDTFFPGAVISNLPEVNQLVNEIDYEFFTIKLAEFNEEFNQYSCGNSAELIVCEARIKTYKVKYARVLKFISRLKKKLKKKYSTLVWKHAYGYFRTLRIEDKTIIFESFLGRNYSDNPKAIYEYMVANYPDYKYVIALNDPESALGEVPGNAELIKRFGFKYVYYLARAKFIVSNSRMTLKYKKRDGQVYIQTWHGTPLKKLVMDQQNVNMPGTNKQNYLINFLNEAKRWDYLISANAHSTKVFNTAFLQDNIIEVGYPRNDILVNASDAYIAKLKADFNLEPEDKVLLYAPTFRDDEYVSKGNYTQKIEIDLERIKNELPDWKVFLRTHYLVTENMDLEADNVINVSDYHDINHLYLVADALMTDYSSVFFDYAILDRPMIFFAYDLEKYENDLRGFYFDYSKTIPGKNIEGTDELIAILSNLEKYEADYKQKREVFRQEFSSLETGTASKQIAELIESYQK